MRTVTPLVAVTDHALERYRQRVARRGGQLDLRPELAGRVSAAWAAGRIDTEPGGRESVPASQRGSLYVRDSTEPGLVFVCLHDRPRNELVVITLWEDSPDPAVPRRFTDALNRADRLRAPRRSG